MTEYAVPRNLSQMARAGGPEGPDSLEAAVRDLTALGMGVLEVALWLGRDPYRPLAAVQTARRWHQHGFTYEDAKPWLDIGGWSAEEASEWVACGYVAREAEFVSTVLRRRMVAGGDFGPPRVAERKWMRSWMPPGWVCLCVAAGVTSPADAMGLLERSVVEPTIRGDLHLRGVVMYGADARDLTFTESEDGLS